MVLTSLWWPHQLKIHFYEKIPNLVFWQLLVQKLDRKHLPYKILDKLARGVHGCVGLSDIYFYKKRKFESFEMLSIWTNQLIHCTYNVLRNKAYLKKLHTVWTKTEVRLLRSNKLIFINGTCVLPKTFLAKWMYFLFVPIIFGHSCIDWPEIDGNLSEIQNPPFFGQLTTNNTVQLVPFFHSLKSF